MTQELNTIIFLILSLANCLASLSGLMSMCINMQCTKLYGI